MTVVENSAVNPGVTATNVLQNAVTKFPVNGNVTSPQNFVLAVGGTLSSTATTTDKLLLFYKVSELKNAYFEKRRCGKLSSMHTPDYRGDAVRRR